MKSSGITYELKITSDDLHVLKCLHSFLVNDGEHYCLINQKDGDRLYYPEIEWNTENKKDLNLHITCDYDRDVV